MNLAIFEDKCVFVAAAKKTNEGKGEMQLYTMWQQATHLLLMSNVG